MSTQTGSDLLRGDTSFEERDSYMNRLDHPKQPNQTVKKIRVPCTHCLCTYSRGNESLDEKPGYARDINNLLYHSTQTHWNDHSTFSQVHWMYVTVWS